eukprot:gene3603-2543_t
MGCSGSKEKKSDEDNAKIPPKPAPKPAPKPVEKPKTPPQTPKEPAPPAPTAADLRAINIKDRFGRNRVGRCTVEEPESATPCFKEGLVYRVEKDGVTYYYNDTLQFEAHVECQFGPQSEIQYGPEMHISEGDNGWTKATCVVYPLCTVEVARGIIKGSKMKVTLEPLSDAYLEKNVNAVNKEVEEEMQQVERVAGGETESEQVLAKCLQNNTLFVDLDFPPHRCLCRPGIDNRKLPPLAFMRPTQYLRDDIKYQSDDIIGPVVPASIDRGYLGDCWVSCAASVIAQSEALVKMIFSAGTSKEKKIGAFRVLLRKNGWCEKVIVDNFLPTVGRQPVFASIIDDPRELWMSLFEKAYAKVNGSYAAITGGDALHVIQDSLGATVYRFDDEWRAAVDDHSKVKELLEKIHELHQNKRLIVLSTPSSKTGPSEKHEKLGLRLGFTYYVTRVVPWKDTVLFHVVNPWGMHHSWTGPWGEGSAEWKDKSNLDAKLDCKPSWNKPGEFWMCWSDLKNYFDGGGIIDGVKDYTYNVRGMFQNYHPTAVLEVKVNAPVHLEVSLTQKDKRGIAIHEPDAIQGAIMLSVAEPHGEEYRVVMNTSSNPFAPTTGDEYNFVSDRSVRLSHTFEPGKPYYIIPRLHHGSVEPQHQREYVVSISSTESLEGKANVEVKHIPKESRVFRNLVSFEAHGITNIEAEMQVVANATPTTRVSSQGPKESAPPTSSLEALCIELLEAKRNFSYLRKIERRAELDVTTGLYRTTIYLVRITLNTSDIYLAQRSMSDGASGGRADVAIDDGLLFITIYLCFSFVRNNYRRSNPPLAQGNGVWRPFGGEDSRPAPNPTTLQPSLGTTNAEEVYVMPSFRFAARNDATNSLFPGVPPMSFHSFTICARHGCAAVLRRSTFLSFPSYFFPPLPSRMNFNDYHDKKHLSPFFPPHLAIVIYPSRAMAGSKNFEFNEPTKAALLEAFQNHPDLLRDLDHAVAECEARAERMAVMEQRKAALMRQNNVLRTQTEAAQGMARPGTGRRHSAAHRLRDEFDESTPSIGTEITESWRQLPYYYEGPTTRGEVSSILPEGRLFRIVKGNQIYFYNDSCYYRMHVAYGFPKSSRVALGVTSRWTKRLSCELGEVSMTLDPLETAMLCTGNLSKASDACRAELITREIEKESKFRGEMSESMKISLREVMDLCPAWMGSPEKHPRKCSTINERAVEECLKGLHSFVDVVFPPTRASLYRDGLDRFYIPPLLWKRPKEFLPPGSDVRLFREKLFVQDPGTEGRFPNRHLISILRILIERNDNALRDLFRHPESALKGKLERLLGANRILLCIAGWWRSVVVDSFVPATCCEPLFTHDPLDLRNTWVLVLEKALAKTWGSYSALLERSSMRLMSALTGSPSFSLQALWPTQNGCSKLAEYLRELRTVKALRVCFETFSMSEACKRRGLPSTYEKLGIGPSQTVACTGVEVIGSSTLLHLQPNRNNAPTDWLDVWQSEGKKWTTEVSELVVGLGSKNTVWMDTNDVPRFFVSGYVSYDISGREELRVKGSFTPAGKPTLAVKVSVKNPLTVLLTLVQPTLVHRAVGFALYATGSTEKLFIGATDPVAAPITLALAGTGQQRLGEEVSAQMTLKPDEGPYFIVPEAGETYCTSPWVLGIFAEALNSDVDISFVHVPENANYFAGTAERKILEDSPATEAEFQLRLANQRISYQKKKRLPGVVAVGFRWKLWSAILWEMGKSRIINVSREYSPSVSLDLIHGFISQALQLQSYPHFLSFSFLIVIPSNCSYAFDAAMRTCTEDKEKLPATGEFQDELVPVRSLSPFPDLLPRDMEDIKAMRQIRSELDNNIEPLPPRCNLPSPYVNDDEVDEFEDNTIDLSTLNVSEKSRAARAASGEPNYILSGPSVQGSVCPVFEDGMLYKLVTEDGTWYYYNDTQKYEMHIQLTFSCKSDVDPGETVELYRENEKDISASLVVLPGETFKLFSGKIRSFRCKARAVPLNDEHREVLYGEINDRIAEEITAIADKIGEPEDELNEERVMAFCQENKEPYIDFDFRPCDYSLYRPELDTYRLRYVPWNRPTAWIPAEHHKEVRLFRRDISPMHVTQGTIGNTYLACAFAALAERPRTIRDLFRHPVAATNGKLERSFGAYWVTMNFNGWWLPVLLDDFLPATVDGPEFTRCGWDVRRLWVALLEKCYAKVHGSYSNIASGDPLEPLTEFTGFPVTRFDTYWRESPDTVFDELQRYQQAGYLQMLCTPTDNGDRFSNAYVSRADPHLESGYEAMGLRLHHGYTVLQVVVLENGTRLVQLRNPWGTAKEWKGPWSKEDSRWNEQPDALAKGYPDGGSPADEDHTFWMEWGDACRIFCGGGCCHLRPQWFDYRVRGKFEEGVPSVCLQVTVSAPTEVYLILSQQDERDDLAVPYCAQLLQLFRRDGKKSRLMQTSSSQVEQPSGELKFNFCREVAIKVTLQPEEGPYFVVPRILDEHGLRTYTLGFLPETYVGNGLRVEFKKLAADCKVFSNMPSFHTAKSVSKASAEYQVRTPRQPLEASGSEIHDERLREFGVYAF